MSGPNEARYTLNLTASAFTQYSIYSIWFFNIPYLYSLSKREVVVHAFNPNTLEAEAEGSL